MPPHQRSAAKSLAHRQKPCQHGAECRRAPCGAAPTAPGTNAARAGATRAPANSGRTATQDKNNVAGLVSTHSPAKTERIMLALGGIAHVPKATAVVGAELDPSKPPPTPKPVAVGNKIGRARQVFVKTPRSPESG